MPAEPAGQPRRTSDNPLNRLCAHEPFETAVGVPEGEDTGLGGGDGATVGVGFGAGAVALGVGRVVCATAGGGVLERCVASAVASVGIGGVGTALTVDGKTTTGMSWTRRRCVRGCPARSCFAVGIGAASGCTVRWTAAAWLIASPTATTTAPAALKNDTAAFRPTTREEPRRRTSLTDRSGRIAPT
jgi:hypothetical protein